MTFYEICLSEIEDGSRFNIDLNNKNLSINKHKFIIDGIVQEDLCGESLIEEYEDQWSVLEDLYQEYKNSIPVETSLGNKSYFKAKDIDHFTLQQMVNASNRNIAQAKLELFILLSSLSGFLKWKDESKFFYQGRDKNFVVLKKWITN